MHFFTIQQFYGLNVNEKETFSRKKIIKNSSHKKFTNSLRKKNVTKNFFEKKITKGAKKTLKNLEKNCKNKFSEKIYEKRKQKKY